MFTVDHNGDELASRWGQVTATVGVGCARGISSGVSEGAAEARSRHRFKNGTGALERSIVGKVTATQVAAEPEPGKTPNSTSARTRIEPGSKSYHGYIRAGAAHASFVDGGTKAHIIEPKKQRFLAWMGAGGVVFSRRVRHPGTRPDGFMGLAYVKCEGVMVREIEKGVEQAQAVLDR